MYEIDYAFALILFSMAVLLALDTIDLIVEHIIDGIKGLLNKSEK
jgi:hypothetical protein